jgi:hypothetical protein
MATVSDVQSIDTQVRPARGRLVALRERHDGRRSATNAAVSPPTEEDPMSHIPRELANARLGDLLREATEERLAQQAAISPPITPTRAPSVGRRRPELLRRFRIALRG